MDDLSRFCCQNSECPEYGKRGGKNLSVCGRYGPNKQRRGPPTQRGRSSFWGTSYCTLFT